MVAGLDRKNLIHIQMVFTKTIVHVHSNQTPFGVSGFIRGTLALMQFGRDNKINVRLNIQDTELSNNLTVTNYNMNGLEPRVYLKNDLSVLYDDLNEFKENTAPIMVLTTNWQVSPRVLSVNTILDFKQLVRFTPAIYAAALNRLTNELLNIHLSHTVPIIKELHHTDTQYYGGFSSGTGAPTDPSMVYDGYARDTLFLPTDYSIIYVDINTSIQLNDMDTYSLALKIRSSLDLTNNTIILSNNRQLKNALTEILEVNLIPNMIQDSDEPANSVESVAWSIQDDVVNLILIADSKKLYVFSEQSMPVERSYETPAILNRVSTQQFTFFYSKVDISPMPVFQYR